MLFGSRLKKRFISLIGLGILGLAVHFLDVQRPQSFDLFSDIPDSQSEPDYYTVNSHFLEYDINGNLNRSLKSERLLHYPDTELTALDKPQITTYTPDGLPQWLAVANSGLVEGDGSHFQLNQNIIVWQMIKNDVSDSDKPDVRLKLTTEQLNIDLDKDQVSTEQPVLISTPEGDTRSVGLFADMTTNRIELKSQVQGRYQTRTEPLLAPQLNAPKGDQQESDDAASLKQE